MKKNIISNNKRIVITFLVMVVLIACSASISSIISKMEEQNCWNTLQNSIDEVASEIESKVKNDQLLLKSIADIISVKDSINSLDIQDIINGFRPNTMISHIALLLPGDMVILPGEPMRDASAILSFEEEAKRGYHISDKSVDIRDESELILRNFVPILKDGKTVAMLYGVVELDDLPNQLQITAYEKKSAIYIIDGNTGDFIADTWHKSLGNIADMGVRNVKKGYSHETLMKDVTEGNPGHCVFVSSSTGDSLYFCYKPAEINNWSVGISVSEDIAFAKTKK